MTEPLRQNDFPGGKPESHESPLSYIGLRLLRRDGKPDTLPIPKEFQNNLDRMIITSDGMLCLTKDGKSYFTPDEDMSPAIRKRVEEGRKAHMGK